MSDLFEAAPFEPICHWQWIDEADIPEPLDGSVHRHICQLPSGHDGDHECGNDQVTRSEAP